MKDFSRPAWLLASTALATCLLTDPALAQAAAEPSAAPAEGTALEEIVVTATRQSDTVNRVPLSVTAVTQRSLDQQGLKDVSDLSRSVPSVTFRRDSAQGATNVAIRGIVSNNGAPTTGIYLDDTPLQKRNANALVTGNGTPFPQLFDLDRVEVLRGPQGTLYGGSSEGGTVRFITPQPSLTRYSVYAKGEISNTDDGGWNYEGGVAAGGPIVEDKLGFRASAWARNTSGYIDQINRYTGQQFGKNSNSGKSRSVRLAATWAPTDRARITPALYYSLENSADRDDFNEDIPTHTVGVASVTARTFRNTGTVNGVPFAFPAKVFPQYTIQGLDLGPYKSVTGFYPNETSAQVEKSPRTTILKIPTLTLEYDFPTMTAKSITSYYDDQTKGKVFSDPGLRSSLLANSVTGVGSPLYLPGAPSRYSRYFYTNDRWSLAQEFRFSSVPSDSPLSWVAGAFFQSSNTKVHGEEHANDDYALIPIRGLSPIYILGQLPINGDIIADRRVAFKESELAVFGEANYLLTSKLKATAGVRLSRIQLDFVQTYGGPQANAPDGFVGTLANPFPTAPCPTANAYGCPYITTSGSQKESPVTPKAGLSYQADQNNLFYATVAKGYRAGGVNPQVPRIGCAADLAVLGNTPATFNSDTVWSYEGGAKLRLFEGRAQVNSSAFYIDWKNTQVNNQLSSCGFAYVTNAGSAVSKGFDVQAQAKVFGGLTLSGNLAFTDAHYTETVFGPKTTGTAAIIVNKGDPLGASKWSYSIAAQYDAALTSNINGYARIDYQYAGPYARTVGFGAVGYDAPSYRGEPTHLTNARLGVVVNRIDVSLFAQNLFNSTDRLNVAHGANQPYITASTFRPRTIGMTATYRY